jgi:uncharacterized protein YbbK (DUF523 family)
MIIVSACLCGINTRYDGRSSLKKEILKLVIDGKAIPVCPEQLGGLSTPRLPCEIKGGSGIDVIEKRAFVVNSQGVDMSENFLSGAYETLNICKRCNVTSAILKSRSPSCGYKKIYDGSFNGNIIDGNGVTCELLIKNNIKVYNEDIF